MAEERKSAAESPFRSAIQGSRSYPKSVSEAMERADEQFKRYEERIQRQVQAITRLLEHHHAVHPSCAFEDLDEKD